MGEITNSYKTGYLFSLKTGEFLYAIKVYVEARTGNYPKARNVTFVEPPKLTEHEAAVWKKEKWEKRPHPPDGSAEFFPCSGLLR